MDSKILLINGKTLQLNNTCRKTDMKYIYSRIDNKLTTYRNALKKTHKSSILPNAYGRNQILIFKILTVSTLGNFFFIRIYYLDFSLYTF